LVLAGYASTPNTFSHLELTADFTSYKRVDRGDSAIESRLKALGEQYPRYGYLMLLEHERGLPERIVDKGPNMTSRAMFFFGQEHQVKLDFIQPGSRLRTRSWKASTQDCAMAA
jgi:hypothetical protein